MGFCGVRFSVRLLPANLSSLKTHKPWCILSVTFTQTYQTHLCYIQHPDRWQRTVTYSRMWNLSHYWFYPALSITIFIDIWSLLTYTWLMGLPFIPFSLFQQVVTQLNASVSSYKEVRSVVLQYFCVMWLCYMVSAHWCLAVRKQQTIVAWMSETCFRRRFAAGPFNHDDFTSDPVIKAGQANQQLCLLDLAWLTISSICLLENVGFHLLSKMRSNWPQVEYGRDLRRRSQISLHLIT